MQVLTIADLIVALFEIRPPFLNCLDMDLDGCFRLFKFKYFGHGFSAFLFIF